MRIFHDLEARGRNWHKEPPSVLWALWTNINKATRDTPFNLFYRADVVLPPEIYLESARVTHFNAEDQAEVRELDSNLLEEKCNTTLANTQKYQESLKHYYNMSDVDITTLDTTISSIELQGPIMRSQAQQLHRQVNSFLCSPGNDLENRLLPNDLIVIRNQGVNYGEHVGHKEGVGEPRK
jgi:hypothetical protein